MIPHIASSIHVLVIPFFPNISSDFISIFMVVVQFLSPLHINVNPRVCAIQRYKIILYVERKLYFT